MLVLGIETSCDETAAAVVKDGREVLSSVVYSQIPLHQAYGGVVPEIASRSHLEKISGVIREAMEKASLGNFGNAENTGSEPSQNSHNSQHSHSQGGGGWRILHSEMSTFPRKRQ